MDLTKTFTIKGTLLKFLNVSLNVHAICLIPIHDSTIWGSDWQFVFRLKIMSLRNWDFFITSSIFIRRVVVSGQ